MHVFELVKVHEKACGKCPECGTMDTTAFMLNNTHKIKKHGKSIIIEPIRPEEMSGKYRCINCTNQFEWNHSKRAGTVQCLKCASTEIVCISPLASVILNNPDRPALTKRELKRIRFIKKNYQLLKTIEGQIESLNTSVLMTSIDEKHIKKLENVHKEILEEIKTFHIQKEKLYDIKKG